MSIRNVPGVFPENNVAYDIRMVYMYIYRGYRSGLMRERVILSITISECK